MKEQATVNGNDIFLHTLKLDRGSPGASNEIEINPYNNAINQINVKCRIDSVRDDQNIPIEGKYSYVAFYIFAR